MQASCFAKGSCSERLQRITPRIPARFNLVLLKRPGTATFRSQSALAVIEIKNDFRSRVKVISMVGGVDVLRGVVTGRKLHWAGSFHS